MVFSIQFARQPLGAVHVGSLRRLVTAAQQDDQHVPAPDEVEPVTRPEIEAQFTDAFADRFDVAEVAERQTVDADTDALSHDRIPQTGTPFCEHGGLADFDHLSCLCDGVAVVNYMRH